MAIVYNPFTGNLDITGSSAGNVVAPAGGSTDNAVARFDGITGQLLQDSLVTIDDSGNIVTPGNLSVNQVNSSDINTATLETSGDAEVGGNFTVDNDCDVIGNLTVSQTIDASGNVIINSGTPTNLTDVANKDYVDSAISAIPAPLRYIGTWDASTNTPTLENTDTGKLGYVYYVTAAGTVNFGAGNISFDISDRVVNNGATWDKWDTTDAVFSVNGDIGAVVVNAINQLTGDVTASAASGSVSKATSVASIQGTTVSGTTGTGNVVFSASPTLTGTIIAAAANFSGAISASNLSGTNTGDQTITLTGDVAGTGTGSFAATIQSNVVSNSKLAQAATLTLKGNNTGSTTNVSDLTVAQVRAMLGIDVASPGDISETSFSAANNQASPADVTGLAFANATVRSFEAIVSVFISASGSLYTQYKLNGVQRGSSWDMDQSYTGDAAGLVFSITTSGQVQYTSTNISGFVSNTTKYRAITTSV